MKNIKDINLKEYKKILEIEERNFDSDLEKSISIISVLSSIEEKELWNKSIIELQNYIKEMETKMKYSFKPKNLPKNIVIDKIHYTFNLDIFKFSVAQYQDFVVSWGNKDKNFGQILSLFIIPKSKKYNDGYDILQLQDKLEEIFTLDDWNNVCFFFLKKWKNSTNGLLLYSELELKKMLKKEKNPIIKEKIQMTLQKIQQAYSCTTSQS